MREVELRLLFEGVREIWGHDLRGYAPAPLQAAVGRAMKACGAPGVAAFQQRLLREAGTLQILLRELLPQPRGLFDDGAFYRDFRRRVVPRLRTYPSVRIWIPSCAGGDAAMSMAVLLEEEGLGRRSKVYATAECDDVFEEARSGRVAGRKLESLRANYRRAGGRAALDDFLGSPLGSRRGGPTLDRALLSRIVFATHHLATDESINQFQAIVCRGVLSLCGEGLANRIHDLFHRSLGVFGFLGLGRRESLDASPHRDCYSLLARGSRLYWREC